MFSLRNANSAVLSALLVTAGSVVLQLSAAGSAWAEPSPGPGNSSQLITVTTSSGSATSGALSAWDRGADGTWTRVIGPVTAHVGTAGVGPTNEGISRTPMGSYPLTESFGRQPNPGTAMPYFHTDWNDWWNSNTSSPTYNTHVRQPGSPGGGSENLYGVGAIYDYAVNIGYNLARTPGAGSAFFLHVTDNGPTGGCVAIDKPTLVGIMRWLDPARNPYIDIRVGAEWTPDSALPIGSFDPGSASGSTFTAHGWAFDPDNPAAPIDVHVYDYRPDGSVAGVALTANDSRPDVGAVYPQAGAQHGFRLSISLAVAGTHRICAFGINIGGGVGNPSIGCQSITIGPLGSLDEAINNQPGSIQVAGWAADQLAAGVQETVHFYVSGPAGTVGYPTGITGGSRPDVAAVYPWAGGATGFSASVPTNGAGAYTVCAYAINVGEPRTNPQIGCRSLTVRDSFGRLDLVAAAQGSIQLGGWVLNPNQPDESVSVHVYDTGPTQRRFQVLTAAQSRPDVAAAYPGYGAQHGFDGTFGTGEAGLHTICAFAIATHGGATNSLIGCRQVVV